MELGGKLRIVGEQIGEKTDMAGLHRATLAEYAIWLCPLGFDFNLIKYVCYQLFLLLIIFPIDRNK